jgi:thiol-disulfide isomerase/thioredoxin
MTKHRRGAGGSGRWLLVAGLLSLGILACGSRPDATGDAVHKTSGSDEAQAASTARDPAEAAKNPVAKDYFPLAVPAPAFELPDIDQATIKLADFHGKVVLLDFWATWCGPCKMAIPHLKELASEYGDQGLVVVGISLDQGGFRVLTPFVRSNGINYPVLLGGQQVAADYGGIRSIPTMFLIDRDGLVRKRYVGLTPAEVLVKDLKVLLDNA